MMKEVETKYPECEKLIAVDFDGVIHDNSAPFSGDPCDIPGDAIAGAAEAIAELSARGWKVAVFTVRAKTQFGRLAVERWLDDHDITYDLITAEKPNAAVILDDRAITFKGSWDGLIDELEAFEPWNRKPGSSRKSALESAPPCVCGSGPSSRDCSAPAPQWEGAPSPDCSCAESPYILERPFVRRLHNENCDLRGAIKSAVEAHKAYEQSHLGGKMAEQIETIKRFNEAMDELEKTVKGGRHAQR